MRAVDRMAGVAAFKAGLARVEAATKADMLALAEATGARNFAHGIYVARRKPSVAITDDAAFVAWVQEHNPGEIVPTVRDSYRKAIESQLVNVGGEVVLKTTGETVEWATVGSEGAAYVGVKLDPEIWEEPIAAIADRFDEYMSLPELPS